MSLKPRRFGLIFVGLLALLVAGGVLWTWLAMHWSYSEGERAGVLQKFSKKGWICKTYEGELALYVVVGVAPQIWYFSTRDEALAKTFYGSVGQHLQVHYQEHRGVPGNCFGDTQYFAESFKVVHDPR